MNCRDEKGNTRRVFFDFSACTLIITTHFANYITYIGYTKFFPDIFLLSVVLLAIALILTVLLQVPSVMLRTVIFSLLILIILSDAIYEYGTTNGSIWLNVAILVMLVTLGLVFFLRAHINKILVAVFASVLLLIVFRGISATRDGEEALGGLASAKTSLPVVVHLVLDEHMGTDGMSRRLPGGESLRGNLEDFYSNNGFRLFSKAYSEYFETQSSLASAFNMEVSEVARGFARKNRNKYILTKNAYLEYWADRGYAINVLQSSYFDFCKNSKIAFKNCVTYKFDAFDSMSISSIPVSDRVILIGNMYLGSFTLLKLARLSEQFVKDRLERFEIYFSGFGLWHGRVGPIAVASPFDRLVRSISRSSGGEVFFAHLMMPHYPYVYDSSCRIKIPISSWLLRTREDGSNTPKSRAERYAQYFDQIRCTMHKLQSLFDAMKKEGIYHDATIIIHGDHGSRIMRIAPMVRNMGRMSAEDFVDGFSTLFAIKVSGIVPGTENRMLPLPRLLRYATSRREEELRELSIPHVFLSDDGEGYRKTPVPGFFSGQ